MKHALKVLSLPLFVLFLFAFLSSVAYSQSSVKLAGINLTKCGIVAYEGTVVDLTPTAYDPDPEIGPAGTFIWEFSSPFNSSGMWATYKGQRGIYPFWVAVSDGELRDVRRDCVELLPNNRNPILLPMGEVYIVRGESTKISATCYDPDKEPVEINYRFMGKDVAFIRYEPPGVYDLEAICTDGYGGVAIQHTRLHILMEKSSVENKQKKVFIPPPVPKPSTVELVLPKSAKNNTIEVASTPVCTPCPLRENIDVVVYDTIEPLTGSKNTTGTFVIESKPALKPLPAPTTNSAVKNDVVIKEKTDCSANLARKKEISKVLGSCC